MTVQNACVELWYVSNSDAHFRGSPIIDWLKSPKTDCSNPLQDLGLIKIGLWWSRVPLFLRCCGQTCCYFPTKFKPRFSVKDRRVDQCIWTAEAPRYGWSKWPCVVHSQSVIMLFLRRLYSWTESKFMIRSHVAAAVPGLTDSDVNFNFSCSVHSYGFCFLQVWCPAIFPSWGHRVLLKFCLQDTLSYKVMEKCAPLCQRMRAAAEEQHVHRCAKEWEWRPRSSMCTAVSKNGSGGRGAACAPLCQRMRAVSYTHLTLPTRRTV